MILLKGTSDLLRLITSTSADVEVHVSWMEGAAEGVADAVDAVTARKGL